MARVKCKAIRRHDGARIDPELFIGLFYDVIGEEKVLGDPTPWLVVQRNGNQLTRPRHMFGRILQGKPCSVKSGTSSRKLSEQLSLQLKTSLLKQSRTQKQS